MDRHNISLPAGPQPPGPAAWPWARNRWRLWPGPETPGCCCWPSDAADDTRRRVQHFAEAGHCVWLQIPFTKAELGQATGRGSAAVAAITDIGLAVAVVHRLAEMDPEKYDEDLAKLETEGQACRRAGK